MYLVKTTLGDLIPIDADELAKLAGAKGDALVFLRNGAITRRMISTITKDTKRMEEVLRRPGETQDDVNKRILEERSEDIFGGIREALEKGQKKLGSGE